MCFRNGRFWSDFLNAQNDLYLRQAHISGCTFSDVAAQLFCSCTLQVTGNPRYNDNIFYKDVAIKMNLLLYRTLNELGPVF